MDDFNKMSLATNNNMFLDMEELKEKYVIYGKLPGAKIEDMTINYENDHIAISALINRSMTRCGDFSFISIQQIKRISKDFYIPNVDIKKITGDFDGVNLIIHIPKVVEQVSNSIIIDVDEYTYE